MMAGSASLGWAFAAVVGLTVLSRSGVHAQCQATTPATACSSTVGETTASLMPAGSGNEVWYKYELTEGVTYTFFGERWIGPYVRRHLLLSFVQFATCNYRVAALKHLPTLVLYRHTGHQWHW